MNMYIGNLNYRVREEDLKEAMGAYGVVTSVKIIIDRETGRSKGFAFVEMENDQEAAQAMSALNGSELMGRQLVIKEALPKKM
ncbi:RNA recognition motif domain-containing protein [Phocaeicola sp.]